MPETQEDVVYKSPYDFLESIEGAPTKAQIENWKTQAPGGKIRLFTPDGKRVFILRAISGFELADVQKQIPVNASDPEREMKYKICAKATIWTNITNNNLLDEMSINQAPAGLPETLHTLIATLSDFFDPDKLNTFSADF